MDHPREQAFTLLTTTRAILRDPAFRRGLADKRAGRPYDLSQDNDWNYGRGRQFACIVPLDFEPIKDGKVDPVALHVLEGAFSRKWIV
jgi:hypothetical protein